MRARPLSPEWFHWAESEVKARLDASRFQHTLGVVECAAGARRGVRRRREKARAAALLHDVAKGYDRETPVERGLGVWYSFVRHRTSALRH